MLFLTVWTLIWMCNDYSFISSTMRNINHIKGIFNVLDASICFFFLSIIFDNISSNLFQFINKIRIRIRKNNRRVFATDILRSFFFFLKISFRLSPICSLTTIKLFTVELMIWKTHVMRLSNNFSKFNWFTL